MVDREKVKDGLYRCTCPVPSSCRGCPYNESNLMECFPQCSINLCKDALELLSELLKEQEPIQMKVLEDYGSIKFGYCPKCKSLINNRSYPKSCGCGKAVKWDD